MPLVFRGAPTEQKRKEVGMNHSFLVFPFLASRQNTAFPLRDGAEGEM